MLLVLMQKQQVSVLEHNNPAVTITLNILYYTAQIICNFTQVLDATTYGTKDDTRVVLISTRVNKNVQILHACIQNCNCMYARLQHVPTWV